MGKRIIYFLAITIIATSFILMLPKLKTDNNGELTIEISPLPEKTVELVTLYFPDKGHQYLVRENRIIEHTVEPKEKLILEELLKGPLNGDKDFAMAPTVKLYSVAIINGTAYVNLSEEFKSDLQFGKNNETLAVYSIVNSLTEIRTIKNVQILVEGQELDVLQKYMPLKHHYKQNLNIVNNPIKTPIETVKYYFSLIENEEYRKAFDFLYNPSSVNIDYSMYYHYQKEKDIKVHSVHSYEMTEEGDFAIVTIDYDEITGHGDTLYYKNESFKLKNDYGEWKITIENMPQLFKYNKAE